MDSGLSMQYIRDLILQQNPASFKVVTLLYKPASVKTNIQLDYVGFHDPLRNSSSATDWTMPSGNGT